MANRLINSRPQFWSSTAPYNGGKLYFYASGTSTPLDTFNNPDLAVAHTNSQPVVLNSAGRPSVDIWLQDLSYKVTLTDSNDVVIWTCDPVYSSDVSTVAQFYSIAGTPNGNLAGTAGSSGVPADSAWDITNNVLYVCTTSGTSSTAVWTAVNASSATPAVMQPQGRLTLTSATPVLAADVASSASVFYTPYMGNLVPLYSGAAMIPTTFAELTLTLNATPHVANGIYDVFVFSNSGVVTIATGPIWTTLTAGAGARGAGAGTTQLSRVAGFLVNTVSMTAKNGATSYTIAANRGTYLGSIYIDGTAAQVTCHLAYGQNRKWGVWNAYNRVPVVLQGGDPAASWAYQTATVRASNATPAALTTNNANFGSGTTCNALTVFSGLAEEDVNIQFSQRVQLAVATGTGCSTINGIGYNSITVMSGSQGTKSFTNTTATTLTVSDIILAHYLAAPLLGTNQVFALENAAAVATDTWFGTEASMKLTATWRA